MNDILLLSDGEGNEAEMIILDTIFHKGKEYVVLIPNEEDYDGPVIIMVHEKKKEYFFLHSQNLINEIYEIFEKRHN